MRALLARLDAVAALLVATVVLAGACVVGGVLAWRHHQDLADQDPATKAPTAAQQAAYGQATSAAESTVEGLINIDYRDPEKSYDAVSSTATGDFLDQYRSSTQSLGKLVKTYQAVQKGDVVASAVSTIDADSATVLVYAQATLRNAQTGEDQEARTYRMLVGLVRSDGDWLTSSLEFVG